MKRLLPVIIALCLIGTFLSVIPKNNQGKTSIPTSLSDLNGKKVAIQTGCNYELILAEVAPGAEAVFFSEFPSMYPAVMQGKVDFMLTETMSYTVERLEHPNLVNIDESLASLNARIGVSKSAKGDKFYGELNEYLEKIKADGSYYKMYDYWFVNYDRGNSTVDKSGITGENGVIRATCEASFEPACFAGEGGELIGYDIDFLYGFCREYGYEPEIVPLDYDAMTASLASGRVDIGLCMLEDEERAEEIKFTESFIDFDLIALYDDGTRNDQGFFKGLINSFYKTFIKESRWKMFLQGSEITLSLSFVSVVFGSCFGMLLYLWCMHGKKAESRFTSILCWLASSTPTVVFLMILYYIIFSKYAISNFIVASIGFSIVFGCGFYELIVSGVKAVGKGQEEAARAQGFSMDQTFFRIILPQAADHFFPSFEGNVISIIQETSVVGYIAVMDLTKMSDLVRGRTFEAFFPLLSTAAIYFLLIWIMTFIVRQVSIRTNNKNRKTENILKGIITKDT